MSYRIISFLVLFVFVGVTLYFYTMNSHFVMEAAGNHSHAMFEVPEDADAPSISLEIEETTEGAVLELDTKHFELVRDSGGDADFQEGHAHLYVNGEREGRIFAASYPLGDVKEDLEIRVVLSTHSHEVLVYQGEEIAAETVYQAARTN